MTIYNSKRNIKSPLNNDNDFFNVFIKTIEYTLQTHSGVVDKGFI